MTDKKGEHVHTLMNLFIRGKYMGSLAIKVIKLTLIRLIF